MAPSAPSFCCWFLPILGGLDTLKQPVSQVQWAGQAHIKQSSGVARAQQVLLRAGESHKHQRPPLPVPDGPAGGQQHGDGTRGRTVESVDNEPGIWSYRTLTGNAIHRLPGGSNGEQPVYRKLNFVDILFLKNKC